MHSLTWTLIRGPHCILICVWLPFMVRFFFWQNGIKILHKLFLSGIIPLSCCPCLPLSLKDNAYYPVRCMAASQLRSQCLLWLETRGIIPLVWWVSAAACDDVPPALSPHFVDLRHCRGFVHAACRCRRTKISEGFFMPLGKKQLVHVNISSPKDFKADILSWTLFCILKCLKPLLIQVSQREEIVQWLHPLFICVYTHALLVCVMQSGLGFLPYLFLCFVRKLNN